MRRATIAFSSANAALVGARGASVWAGVPMGPPDAILGLAVAFKADPHPSKVNLGVGVYRGDNNLPCVLECVKKAQTRLLDLDHEYAPISGLPRLVSGAQRLAFGDDSDLITQKRLASMQSLSGTGSLRVAGEFLNAFAPTKTIYLPTPTWGNHGPVFKQSHLQVASYRYYDPKTLSLDLDGLLQDLSKVPAGSVVLLHACAHNPTGLDPTPTQWVQIAAVLKERKAVPLVDMAYQGFASGSLERDAFVVRLLGREMPQFLVCQSFAKNFGLYGQRVGAMHVVCADADESARVESQLKIIVRPMYSNPPLHGARIVETILHDPELYATWLTEVKEMAERMDGIRKRLVKDIGAAGSSRDWSHMTRQIGMMAFTGLNQAQVERLKAEFHIYMTADGRAAITGLNTGNVEYVAKAFHAVSK